MDHPRSSCNGHHVDLSWSGSREPPARAEEPDDSAFCTVTAARGGSQEGLQATRRGFPSRTPRLSMGLFENSLTEQEEETEPVPKRFWLLLLERCSGSSLARLCSPDQTVQGAVQCLSDRSGHSARHAGGEAAVHSTALSAQRVWYFSRAHGWR